jgi:hypothetical protein
MLEVALLKIFLNHASEDRALVMPYFDRLKALGYDPWIDRELLPGQDWNEEIQRAFHSSDVVLFFMSPRSVKKRGYVQKEIYDALERLKFLAPGDIGAIPLLLEECEVPVHVARSLQFSRLPNEWHKVVSALSLAASQRSIAVNHGKEIAPFQVYLKEETHVWDGYPGYNVEIRLPHFESATVPSAAIELNEFILSIKLAHLLDARRVKERQNFEHFSAWAGSENVAPSDFLDVSIEPILVSESILSFITFEAGCFAFAAHGFHDYTTHNFTVRDDSLIKLILEDFFSDPYAACDVFTSICREKIAAEWTSRFEEPPSAEELKEIDASFPCDWSTFRRFSLNKNGITIYFPPYTLGGYVAGSWIVDINFNEISVLLKVGGPHLLAEKAAEVSLPVSSAKPTRWELE